ncbi:hypothetical protein CEXT_661921 [Caerostris extrusa]|uniref:Uncharacterized protein n=1 Tax=Caerostris extrusa TaxID=172846 RepID=A0AAV4XXM7_CAEEX|nr:hypothetical protein CEXT_661921 [Caerostris extrusa]
MVVEVVVYAFIGILAVLALLTQWRKKYNRFVPDNNHSVFQVFVDAVDSIFSLHLERRTPCTSSKFPVERAKEAARSLFPKQHAQRIPQCLQRACTAIGRVSARGNRQTIHEH